MSRARAGGVPHGSQISAPVLPSVVASYNNSTGFVTWTSDANQPNAGWFISNTPDSDPTNANFQVNGDIYSFSMPQSGTFWVFGSQDGVTASTQLSNPFTVPPD